MGVDYSATVGYGFVVPREELNKKFVDEEEIEQWLEDSHFDRIGYSLVGNFWSGENFGFFFVIGTEITSGDMRDDTAVIHDIGKTSIYSEEYTQLSKLRLLKFSHDKPKIGWKLIRNVT